MPKRLHELDSLRGIAAVSVLLFHFLLVIPIMTGITRPEDAPLGLKLFMFSPLRAVWAGHESVIFFFVLSGFVLALLFFNSGRPPSYRDYLIKRIIRIYPPYFAAVLLAIFLRQALYDGQVPAVSDFFNGFWQVAPTGSSVADHVLMLGSFENRDFNPVIWSLVHEMRISIIFPLIVWTLQRHEKACLMLPVLFTFIFWLTITLRFRGVITFDHDYFDTLHYTGFFILGGMLAKHRERLIARVSALPKRIKWLLLATALGVYTNAYWLPHYGMPGTGMPGLLLRKPWFQEWLAAAGVAAFMILALSSGSVSGLLSLRPLQYLGSISYSLYLFHMLALKVVVTLLIQFMPLSAALGIAVACALLVASASWRLIEVPCVRLGRKLTTRKT